MPDGHDLITIKVINSISQVDPVEWDACAGSENPFVSHAFLNALEQSGAVDAESGWAPHHLVMVDQSNQLYGAAPLYLKSHSQGEYVFDHGWADAYERAGGRYYPKLISAVPFTPVTGPRLLVRPDVATGEVEASLCAGMIELAERYKFSSIHVTFLAEHNKASLEGAGFFVRHSHQYHWMNRGYESFDDFLASLTSRRRKTIRKERERIANAGITFEAYTGSALTSRHWDTFYDFYTDTYDRKWGFPYLNREFFELANDTMAERIVLITAYEDGRPIAGAFNLLSSDAIYGRNWGCNQRYKFLHFEACYYQAIDFAIAHRLDRVEAGTQGPHKIQRGYEPVQTYSAHWIRDSGFRDAVENFLEREKKMEAQEMEYLTDHTPFRNEDGQ